jgi:FMN phosphatase YigB (HAD superfamily)
MDTFIFDFDGVLSPDNTEVVLNTFKDVIAPSSMYSKMIASRHFYDAMMGKISFLEFKHAMAKLADIDMASMEKITESMMDSRILDAEVLHIVKQLKEQGHSVVLHSDFLKVPFDHFVRKFDLRNIFDVTMCSAYIGSLKNDTETWVKVLKVLNKKGKDCVLIDDRSGNVDTAVSQGLYGIVFENSAQLLRELEKLGIVLG